MAESVNGLRIHPAVDTDRFTLEEIEMVLDHGLEICSSGSAARTVYGPISVVTTHDRILAAYYRNRINDITVLEYDELKNSGHFSDRMEERDLYEAEIRDVVDDGVFFYQQHSWYYVGDVNGNLVKVVRSGDTISTVYWLDENPRDWENRDRITNTYMERRRARKASAD